MNICVPKSVYRLMIVAVFAVAAISAVNAHSQTTSVAPTVVNVSSSVQQPSVKRMGIVLGDQSYWGSSQILKNLIFGNSGFEGMGYRSILHCATVSSTTCTDTNQYSPMPDNYWKGAKYHVVSGSAINKTGTVVSSLAGTSVCKSGCGIQVTFDTALGLAAGDYVSVEMFAPGNPANGWWTSLKGAGAITADTTDLSPNTTGKQAIKLSAPSASDGVTLTSGFDTQGPTPYILLNGHFRLSFRAKGAGGTNKVTATVWRQQNGVPYYLNQTITASPTAWTDYALDFTAAENSSTTGSVQVFFSVSGSSVLLDDATLVQTDSDASNPTALRDDVFNTLKDLNPGVIRNNAGTAIGANLYDQMASAPSRYPMGFYTGADSINNTPIGIFEFLQICEALGAEPWITIPTATNPQEMKDFMDYLQGTGTTTYSALRVAQGQNAPWTSVFPLIHIELGNEVWNSGFAGENMNYPAYPLWANQVFGAARQTPGFDPTKFDLVLSGWASGPSWTQTFLQYSTQHDSIDIAPYLMDSVNTDTTQNQFSAMFAEPEMFNSPGGEVYQNQTVANQAMTSASGTSKPTKLHVYEVNMSTEQGTLTQTQADQLVPSVGAGITLANHMLQMMRGGVVAQNFFDLGGFSFRGWNGITVKLWGSVVGMGANDRRRPSFLTEALSNTAIMGDMLQTTQTGTNPTWSVSLPGQDNVKIQNAHYIQSFSFLSGKNHSVVLFNLHQTASLPVTFAGPNAPSGTVNVSQITSANMTDNNETADTVQTTSTTANISSASPLSLPPFSMTVLTWTGPGSESSQSAASAPAFSIPSGSYAAGQMVSLSTATAGASIYYTTNGTTPTTSSTKYTGAMAINANTTLSAIATATGYTSSPVATATYTVSASTLAAPVMSPAPGTYTTAQSVTISSAAGSTIYYTTNGSAPTTASTKYTGAISVSASETLNAIAVETNYTNSPVTTGVYQISSSTGSGSASSINFASGFTSAGSQLDMNGNAVIKGSGLQLTSAKQYQASSAYFSTPVNVQSFTTDFTFQQVNPAAQGMTFTIQNAGATAIGPNSSSLGYEHIPTSVAIKFDLYNTKGEGSDSTGIYTNGASPTVPAVDMTSSGVNLHSGDVMHANLVYDGTNLKLTLTDTVTNAVFTKSFAINIPSTVGGNTALVGFTGSTGFSTATQSILTWTYTAGSAAASTPAAAKPVFSPAGGTYTSAQNVNMATITPNGVIYYTTDGSTPTPNSAVYSGPISVSASETLNAITVANGFTTSATASSAYVIKTAAPATAVAPVIAPGTGTYTSAQTVTITDATNGAVIYYTTDGSTPTTSSTVYSSSIRVTSTSTVQAIAVVSGASPSPMTQAVLTIQSAASGINYSGGFNGAKGTVIVNGNSTLKGSALQLTANKAYQAGSAWYYNAVNVQSFTTDFTFQVTNPVADGFTFAIQNNATSAVGPNGGGLGYTGMKNSAAVKFDLFSNKGEGPDSTGVYTDGAVPMLPAVDMSSSGIDLHSGDVFAAHITYDGKTLTLKLTDTTTNASFTTSFAVNIPAAVGGNTAYVGFTGGTGSASANQQILTWTYEN